MNNVKFQRAGIFITALLFILTISICAFSQEYRRLEKEFEKDETYSRMLDLFEEETTTMTESNGNWVEFKDKSLSQTGQKGKKVSELQKQIIKLRQKNVALKEKEALLEDRLADLKALNRKLSRLYKKSKQEALDLDNDLDELRMQNVVLKKKELFLETRLEDIDGHDFGSLVDDLAEYNVMLEEELMETKKQLERKTKRLTKTEKRLDRRTRAFEKRIKKLSQENISLQRRAEGLKGKVVSYRGGVGDKVVAQLYEDLGTAYIKARLNDKAIEAYLESLNYDPKNPTAHYHLGLLFEHTRNDSKKALHYLSKFLSLSPDASQKKRVRYLIKVIKRDELGMMSLTEAVPQK